MFNYEFALCLDAESWHGKWDEIDPTNQLVKRNYPATAGATTFFEKHSTLRLDNNLAVVTLDPSLIPDEGIEIAAILCHEAVHIKQKICEHIMEDKMSDEVEAYLVQYIAGGLMHMYKEMML